MARPRRRRSAVPLEKVEQAQSLALLAALGGQVYTLGTRRPKGKPCPTCGTFMREHQGTCQTEGISDALVFLPRRPDEWPAGLAVPVTETTPLVLLALESKRSKGSKVSDEQKRFRDLCVRAGLAHVLGDTNAVIAWVLEHGYLRPDQIPHYRLPKETR